MGKSEGAKKIAGAIQELNSSMSDEAEALTAEFEKVTNVKTDLKLPEELGALFRAFSVATAGDLSAVPLHLRGDGIQARYLPSLLHYVSTFSNRVYLWGFEEPENNLEHALATDLAKALTEDYSGPAQVFVTSHSPAFFDAPAARGKLFRVFREDRSTLAEVVEQAASGELFSSRVQLQEELGLMDLQRRQQQEYVERLAVLRKEHEMVRNLKATLEAQKSPLVLTEGKWDVIILNEAWKRVRGGTPPFRIQAASTGGTSGGVPVLMSILRGARTEPPILLGIFDRDHEGLKNGFEKLIGKTFVRSDFSNDVLLQEHGACAAVVLPVPLGREAYAAVPNLPIEFLFPDSALSTKVGVHCLELSYPSIHQQVGTTGVKLPSVKATEPHLRQIGVSSKAGFAQHVVPTLPDSDFSAFKGLFDLIDASLDALD